LTDCSIKLRPNRKKYENHLPDLSCSSIHELLYKYLFQGSWLYNLLILSLNLSRHQALNRTLYLAFPELLKFLLCAGLLFLAFSLTGYIVLSPFHPKFRNFYETIETLFCLLNGDDMYTTFDRIDEDDDQVAYFFSRIFLYLFLVLFIYFVLNLFTSLVITAYEASQVIFYINQPEESS